MTRERWLKIADWIDFLRGYAGVALLTYLMIKYKLR
jgi:hypothetical protein